MLIFFLWEQYLAATWIALGSRPHRNDRSFSSRAARRAVTGFQIFSPAGYPWYFFNSSVALVPPNPKELDMAKFTVPFRATFGT